MGDKMSKIEEVKRILKRQAETLDDLPPYTIVPPRSEDWYEAKAKEICQLFEPVSICVNCVHWLDECHVRLLRLGSLSLMRVGC